MAIKYGISGKTRGKVGALVYNINAGQNIVKERAIHINDAKTYEQVEQRSRMQNAVKAFNNIGSDFLKSCFKKKKQTHSYYNEFVSYNARNSKNAYCFFEKFSKDEKIIGIGRYVISKGDLPPVPVVSFQVGDDTFFGIKVEQSIAVDGSAKISAVSTSLMKLYGQVFQNGYLLNGIGVLNYGAHFENSNELLTLEDDYHVETIRKNFVIDNTDSTKISDKGFCVVEGDNNDHYLTLAKDDTTPSELVGNALDTSLGIGYCGFLVAFKNGSKIRVSTCHSSINKELSDLLNKIDSNPVMLENGWLSTVMKVLIIVSYGIKKTIEIIRDWPI